MPTYSIRGEDGRTYSIDGEAGATEEQVWAAIQQELSSQQSDTPAYDRLMQKEPGFLENVGTGLGAGFVGTLESGATGLATLLDEDTELKAREAIQSTAEKFTPEGGDKDSITYGLANAIGSVGGFAAPGIAAALLGPASAAGAIGTGTAAALGVASQAGEASERARAAGTTEEERNKAIRWAAPVGVTEVLPLGRMSKLLRIGVLDDLVGKLGPKTVTGIRNRIWNASLTGGAEAAQEVTQELVQNLVEQGYNPAQALSENLGPAAGYGGGAGALIQVMVDLFAGRRLRNAKNANKDDQEVDKAVDETLLLGYDGDANKLGSPQGKLKYDPFIPKVFPDGSVGMTPQDVAGYKAGLVTEPEQPVSARQRADEQRINAEANAKVGNEEQTDAFPLDLITALGLQNRYAEEDKDYPSRGGQSIPIPKPQALSPQAQTALDKVGQREQLTLEAQLAENRKEKEVAAQDEIEMAQLEAEIEQEATHQAAYQQGIAALQQKKATAETDIRVADAQKARTVGARRVILDNMLANKLPSTPVAAARNFTKKLTDAKFQSPMATPIEMAAIKKAFIPPVVPAVAPADASKQLKQSMLDEVDKPKFDAATEAQLAEQATAVPITVPEKGSKNELQPVTRDDQGGAGVGTEGGEQNAPVGTAVSVEPTPAPVDAEPAPASVGTPDVPASGVASGTEPKPAALAPAEAKTEFELLEKAKELGIDTTILEERDADLDKAFFDHVKRRIKGEKAGVAPNTVKDKERPAANVPVAKTEAEAESPSFLARDEEDGTESPDDNLTDPEAEADAPKTKPVVAPTQKEVAAEIKKATGDQKLYGPEEVAAAVAAAKSSPDAVAEAITSGFTTVMETLKAEAKAEAAPKKTAETKATAPIGDKPAKQAAAEDTASSKKALKAKPKVEEEAEVTPEQQATFDAMSKSQKEKARVSGDSRTEAARDIGDTAYLTENPTEPVSVGDYKTVVALLETPKSKLDAIGKAAYTYFNDARRVIDNLTDIAYDMAYGVKFTDSATDSKFDKNNKVRADKYNKPSAMDVVTGKREAETVQENAFRDQKGGSAAVRATQWVRANLSAETNAILSEKLNAHFEQYLKVLSVDPLTLTPMAVINKQAMKERAKGEKVIARLMEANFDAQGEKVFTKKQIAEYEAANPEQVKATADKIAADNKNATDATPAEVTKETWEAVHKLLEMPAYAMDATGLPIHPVARQMIADGDIKGAFEVVAQTSPNPLVRRVASEISKNIGDTKVKMVKGLKNPSGRPAGGVFDPSTNTISINDIDTLPVHVLLHEGAHAVLSHTLDNKSHPLTKKLQKLYDDVKDDLSSHYGSESLQEFVSEALTNTRFQQELASLYAGRKSDLPAWRQFLNTVTEFFKKLLKIPSTGTYAQLNDMLVGLMSPAPATRGAGELYMQSLTGELNDLVDAYNKGETLVDEEITRPTRDTFMDMVKGVFAHDIPSVAKQAAFGFMQSYPLADATTAIGIHGSHDMHSLFLQFDSAVDELNKTTDAFTGKFAKWRKEVSPEMAMIFDRIRAISTRDGVDPSKPESRYKGVEKNKSWNEMQEGWEALGDDGQMLYQQMKEQYEIAYERLKGNLEAAIKKIDDAGIRKSLKEKIFKDIFDRSAIDPYFPLWRTGKFWLQYSANLDGQNETVYEIYKTPDARKARYNKILAMADDPNNNLVDKGSVEQYEQAGYKKFEKAPPTPFIKEAMAIFEKMEVDEATKNMFMELFIRSLPETSYAKRLQKRTGDPGFELDSLETFRQTAYDLNRQSQQLKYGRDIRAQMDVIRQSGKVWSKNHPTNLQNRDTADVLVKEWEMRSEFAVNPDADWKATMARNANRFAFAGTIGFSPSSAIVNLTQIPMVVFPYLAGKTSLQTAYKSLNTARSLLTHAGLEHSVWIEGENGEIVKSKSFAPSIDNYYIRDPKTGFMTIRDDVEVSKEVRRKLEEIRPMIQFMSDNAQLSRSVYYDTLGVEISGKSKNILDQATAVSAYMFHITERTNRQIAIVGSYLNELDRLKNNPNPDIAAEQNLTGKALEELAIKNAFHDAQYTNGGAVLSTAPRWAQKNVGRVAMMFKSFGIMMYTMQGKLLHKMVKGKTKGERQEAMRQFFGVQGMVALMSGVQGLTIYGMIAGIANMFRDDDEEDFETITRKYLGEGMYKGGINQLSRVLGGEGVDVAARIGLSNLIVASNRYNFDPSVEKSIVKTLGGPFYGYTSQIGRGAADIAEGEYQRGFENFLPAAFRNMAKTVRYASDEAIRTRRGDPIMSDVPAGLLAAQFFGFAPAEYTRNQERAQALKGIDRPVNERRTKLLWLLYRAGRFGEDTTEIMDDIIKFNEDNPDNAIDGKSIATSRKRHMETDPKMYDGVLLSPKMSNRLRDLGDGWDQGFQGF